MLTGNVASVVVLSDQRREVLTGANSAVSVVLLPEQMAVVPEMVTVGVVLMVKW